MRLDAGGLADEALRRTRTDSLPCEIRAGLDALCGSIPRSDLSTAGERLLQSEILRCLTQGIAVRRVIAERGPVEPVRPPVVIITGTPRSGTTFLHRSVTSLIPGAAAPTLSSMTYPAWATDADQVGQAVERTGQALGLFNSLSPSLRELHPMHPLDPEECIHALALSMGSERFSLTLHVPEYDEWLDAQDPKFRFRELGRFYDFLFASAAPHASCWILKAPTHVWSWPAVLAALRPDAIVAARRDIGAVRDSYGRLISALRAPFTNAPDQFADADAHMFVSRWEGCDHLVDADIEVEFAELRDPGCARRVADEILGLILSLRTSGTPDESVGR